MPEQPPFRENNNGGNAGRAKPARWDSLLWRLVFFVICGGAFVFTMVALRIAIKYFFD